MSSTIVIKQCGINNYQWVKIASQLADNTESMSPQVGDAERLAEHCQQDDVSDVMLLVAAESTVLKTASFDDHEKKLLRQTIPYTLEDDCVDDVDLLHFSFGGVTGNTVPLVVIAKQQLEQEIATLEQASIEVQQLVSELSLIPLATGGWSLYIDEEQSRWLLRSGLNEGLALAPDVAAFALQLLLDESEQLPEQLDIYYCGNDQSLISNRLPELLKGIVKWQADDYWQMITTGLNKQKTEPVEPKAINLLQGSYARDLPWKKWWGYWRIPAVLLFAAIIIQCIATYAELSIQQSKNINLRADIEKAYRSVVPRGAVLDAEKQLQRKVRALKGSSGGGFVLLLSQVGDALSSIDNLSIQSMNYTEKQSELRLTILAAGFNDVETARAKLESLGLKAELTGSNTEGNKTRARLRIRG